MLSIWCKHLKYRTIKQIGLEFILLVKGYPGIKKLWMIYQKVKERGGGWREGCMNILYIYIYIYIGVVF